MKRQDLIGKIKEIAQSNPDFLDGVTTKELKQKLENEYQIKASINMLNSVMVELTDIEHGDGMYGYICGDGRYLVRGDEHDNGDSQLRGIHRYCWFLT